MSTFVFFLHLSQQCFGLGFDSRFLGARDLVRMMSVSYLVITPAKGNNKPLFLKFLLVQMDENQQK